MSDSSSPLPAAPPTLFALFSGFFSIGVSGFGGVLPWARRMIVEQRGWLNQSEFNDLLSLCQFLPGPNIINIAVALGGRFRGPAGAIVCFFGLMGAPFLIVLALAMVYGHFSDIAVVRHALLGLSTAAGGLIISMAVKIVAPLRGNWLGIAVAVVTFAIIAVLRTPLLPTLLVMAPLSVVLTWKWGRR